MLKSSAKTYTIVAMVKRVSRGSESLEEGDYNRENSKNEYDLRCRVVVPVGLDWNARIEFGHQS